MADEDVVVAPPSTVRSGGATVVVVAYGVNALLLDWVPATVPVVVVHNDDLLTVSSVDHPAVTHLFPGTNVGFGAGVNAALERVTTSRWCFAIPISEPIFSTGLHSRATTPASWWWSSRWTPRAAQPQW